MEALELTNRILLDRDHMSKWNLYTSERLAATILHREQKLGSALLKLSFLELMSKNSLPEKTPFNLSVLHDIGKILVDLGELAEALVICEEVIEKHKLVIKSSHPEMLNVRMTLADVIMKQG
ncbi:unnamed protein product, partial [Allacma fusca]